MANAPESAAGVEVFGRGREARGEGGVYFRFFRTRDS